MILPEPTTKVSEKSTGAIHLKMRFCAAIVLSSELIVVATVGVVVDGLNAKVLYFLWSSPKLRRGHVARGWSMLYAYINSNIVKSCYKYIDIDLDVSYCFQMFSVSRNPSVNT